MVQTLPRISMEPTETHLADVLNAARSGNADAIARLIGRALAHRGIAVSGTVVGDQLTLQLDGEPLPDQQSVIPLIQRGLMRLGFTTIRSVILKAQATADIGQASSGWTYQFQILDPLNTPLEPHPDAESLVRVHLGDRHEPPALTVGDYRVQDTAHGYIVDPSPADQGGHQPQRRPDPHRVTPDAHNQTLLDRQPETQDALEALAHDTPVEFYGENGLGKSTLLRHLVASPFIQRQFRDGVFLCRAATQPIEDTLQDLFESFYDWSRSVPTKPTDAQCHDAFASLNALMVADDVPVGGEAVLTRAGITVLMSSTHQQMRHTGQSIPMRGLPIPDAIALVEQHLKRPLRDDVERRDADIICRILKGHPLRLKQTIGFLRNSEPPGRGDESPINGHPSGNREIPATLHQLAEHLQAGMTADALTIRAATTLPELERRVLAVLTVFEQVSLPVEHLKPLVGTASLDLTLQILLERGLICVESGANGTNGGDCVHYRLASNLIPYFQQIWDLRPWVERSLSYFTTWIQQQDGAMLPVLNASTPIWWITTLASQQERWPEVFQFSRSLDHSLMVGKRWGRWGQMWEMGLAAARSLGDGAAEALAFHQLGSRALCMGDLFTAHTYLTEAVQRRVALGDDIGAAISQHNLNFLIAAVHPASDQDIPDQAISQAMPTHALCEDAEREDVEHKDVEHKDAVSKDAGHDDERPPLPSQFAGGGVSLTALQQYPIDTPSGTPSAGTPAADESSEDAGSEERRPTNSIQPPLSNHGVGPSAPSPQTSIHPAPSSNGAIAPLSSNRPMPPSGTPSESSELSSETTPASSTHLVAQPPSQPPSHPPSSIAPASFDPDSPPIVYGQVTESRSVPVGWIVVSAIAAVAGGLGAYFALTWNSSPVSITPRSLSFPPQLLGIDSDPRQLTITNTGPESLALSTLEFSAGDRQDFAITNENCTQEVLRPDEDCTVGIAFTPTESGSRSARLRIADGTGEYERVVQVRGLSETAEISTDQEFLAFDPFLAGRGDPPTQTFTFTNDSAVTFSMGPAFISGERTDAFAIAQDGCAGVSLDPNDRCTVEVAFTPPGSGVFEANVAIRDATGEYTWLRPLIGTGELSAPAISPSGVSFGTEDMGQLSTNVVTITNTGTSSLTIEDISLTGDTANFSIRGNTCTRNPIEAGERCSVTVGFIPQSARNYTANLVITDNAVNSPRSIRLTGRGTRVETPVDPPVDAPEVTPNPLQFDDQDIGTAQQQSLTLTNRSNASIRVESVSMPQNGDFGIVDESCTGGSLSPGGTCTITVGFTPQEPGDRSTTITIRDTATGSPRTVNVTGTGVAIPGPQIVSIEATPSTIPAGERARVCYRVNNAEQISLRDGRGTVTPLELSSGCATVTPDQTTTYTLVAEGRNGQTVSRQVRIQVTNPDTTPPPIPAPISPVNNNYVLCSATPSANLRWNSVTDDREPITYTISLERGASAIDPEATVQNWTPVTQQSTQSTELNVTSFLSQGRISYRWQVSARDAAGNESGVSDWVYFRTCE